MTGTSPAHRAARPRVLLALVAVLAIKLAVMMQVGAHPLLRPGGELDGAYYVHLASGVRDGDWALLSPENFMRRPVPPFFLPPLYVYFLALCLKLTGGAFEAARFVQVVLGTAAVCLLALTARRWYGQAAAWWTGALATLCGLFTFYEVTMLQAALEPFLTALDLWLVTVALQDGRRRWWAAAGASLGLHALNRPNMLIVLGGILVVALVHAMRQRRAGDETPGRFGVFDLGALLVAAAIVISPATIRNWRATGELVLISSHAGLNFLIGNNAEADGTFRAVMGVEPSVSGQWVGAPQVVAREVGHEVSASETSRFFFGRAVAWIREHPGAAVGLFVRKLEYTFSASFLPLSHSYPFFAYDARSVLSLLIVGPAILLGLGLSGLVGVPVSRRGHWILATYVGFAALSVAVFFVASRYRLPMQVALTVPAGGTAAWLWARLRARDWASAAPMLAAVAFLTVGASWPLHLDDGRAEEQVRMGLLEIQNGRTAEGETWLQRGLARHGLPGVAHLRVAQVFETLNRPDEAISHYQRAAAINPDEPAVRFGLGRALFAAGRDEAAVAELERARAFPALRDPATQLMALAETRRGRADEATRLARELDPGKWNSEQARRFATAIADLGRADLSVPAWRRASQVGGDPRDFERLGISLALIGNHAEALTALDEAVKRSPTSVSIRLNRAVALASLGRLAEARLEAQAALEIDPAYAKAKEFLSAIGK